MARLPELNSITFRLSFLFAMSAIILLTGTGTFLYRFLEDELMKRDHEELIGKVDLFRHQLSTVDTPRQIVAAPSQFRDVIIGHPHLRLALLDARGNTLLSSADWKPSAELLEHPVAIDTSPDHTNISMPSLAQPYHAVAAWGALGDRRNGKVLIVLGEPDQILEPSFSDFQRNRQQLWEYRERGLQLVFYDETGTGRWRMTQASDSRFELELRRRLR